MPIIFKCPNCDQEIEDLKYSTNIEITEYGIAFLGTHEENGSRIVDIDNMESSDTDYGDSRDTEYTCPECEEYIHLDDIVIEGSDEPEPRQITTEGIRTAPQNFNSGISKFAIEPRIPVSYLMEKEIAYCPNCNEEVITSENEDHDNVSCPKCRKQIKTTKQNNRTSPTLEELISPF